MDQSFRPHHRIKSSADFDRVFKTGRVISDETLVIHVLVSQHDHPRLGLSISKRVGNSPARNLWKRLIREVFRRHRTTLRTVDLVIRPRKGATPSYQAIDQSIQRLAKKLDRP
jgi:ribonuclease P protein component